ncbi:MAG TPA: hypothetical protein VID29_09815 [Solirubrobacteraceae bacterium]|jgi:hypothetical protein
MTDSANYGIKAEKITAQNIAVGPNARIEQTAVGWTGLLGPALADLAGAIADFQGPPATCEVLRAAHAEIATEIAAPAPDSGRLLAKLASLKQLVGPATTIAQTAASLAQAIAAFH